MEEIKLKKIDLTEFKDKLLKYYYEMFPEDERKPISRLEYMEQKGLLEILEIINEETIKGYIIESIVEPNGYIVMDIFAILEEYRHQKIGTKALKLLLEEKKDSKGIYIEIEKCGLGINEEENQIREKRRNFYENLGFKPLHYDLFLFGVMYTPYIYTNEVIDEEINVEEIIKIYEACSTKERIAQNCKFTKLSN